VNFTVYVDFLHLVVHEAPLRFEGLDDISDSGIWDDVSLPRDGRIPVCSQQRPPHQ
jgi:hypothetical protein